MSLTTDQEGHFQPGQNGMQSIQVITSVSSHVRIEKNKSKKKHGIILVVCGWNKNRAGCSPGVQEVSSGTPHLNTLPSAYSSPSKLCKKVGNKKSWLEQKKKNIRTHVLSQFQQPLIKSISFLKSSGSKS